MEKIDYNTDTHLTEYIRQLFYMINALKWHRTNYDNAIYWYCMFV